MTSDISPKILAEQTRVLFKNQPFILATTSVIAVILCFLFFDAINLLLLIIWAGFILVVNGIRAVFLWKTRKYNFDDGTLLKRRKLIVFNALLSGILWAILPLLLLVKSSTPEVFFIITGVLISLSAGLLAPGISIYQGLASFSVPIIVSLSAVALLLPGVHVGLFIPFLYIFLIVVFVIGKNAEKLMIQSIQIRFEKEALIEELNRQKQEAESANLAKSKFLAAASHDLRQPLHALGLYLDTMSAASDIKRMHDLAGKMGIAVEALNDLFQRLLDISKLDAGIIDPNIADFTAGEIFKRLEVRFIPQAKAKNLDIKFSHGNEVLQTDPVLLERILDNLISNAIRYTPSGKITIKSRKNSPDIVMVVSDTGPGIPEGEHENIFGEFYQLQNPERDRTKGLGLGLSIVKRLCSLLDHKLVLESTDNRGTTFLLSVPEGSAENVADLPDSVQRFGWDLRNVHILVIDDEAGILDAMHELLTNWGCSPVCVDSIQDAMTAISKGMRPDLIIADYRLRESQTGVDAIHSIKDLLQKKVPAILITGDTAPERLQEAAKSGFKLLHKPVNPGQLRMIMNLLLGSSHSVESL